MTAKEAAILNSIIAATQEIGERTCVVDLNGKVVHLQVGEITAVHQFLPPFTDRQLSMILSTHRN